MTQDSTWAYEDLQLSLCEEKKMCGKLQQALDEWTAFFQGSADPEAREPSSPSIPVTAATFKALGKPLKSLEAYQLVIRFSRGPADAECLVAALCQSASLLLDLGSAGSALAQLEEAESILSSTTEGSPPLCLLPSLLRAQYYYSTGRVECGMPYLCELLPEVKQHRDSKSWSLLRVQTLHTCSSYLSLDPILLPQKLRSCITQHGLNTPDAALSESLQLLCAVMPHLKGNGLCGTDKESLDVFFHDEDDDLEVKWQLLSELLNCWRKMVALRSSCGAVNDARLLCREALRTAIQLQAISQCAELLVMKAKLELMEAEIEESLNDLANARRLIELYTDFSAQVLNAEGFGVVSDQPDGSTVRLRSWYRLRDHGPECLCPCCLEPYVGRATALWMAIKADCVHQTDHNQDGVILKLYQLASFHSETIVTKLGARLVELFPPRGPAEDQTKPSLMQDVVGHVHLQKALFALKPRLEEGSCIWDALEAGLAFVESSPSPVLRPVKAGLMKTKAIALMLTLAAEKGCSPEELFSRAWPWNGPEEVEIEERVVEEDVQSLLRSAWSTLHHLPPPTTYPKLCCLLALNTGQQDPMTTAMLHAESLGVSYRHLAVRHSSDCRTASSSEQSLENMHSFSTATFPESQEFTRQMQHIPPGVTVCLMSVVEVKPGAAGDSILLSHLEKDCIPVTVLIPTAKEQHSISWVLQEMISIVEERKDVEYLKNNAEKWKVRKSLDSRLKPLCKKMEGLLGCWKSFLLPVSSDSELSTRAQLLCQAFSSRGVKLNQDILKVVLSASHVLTKEDLKRFGHRVYPRWDAECDLLLQTAATQLSVSSESQSHMVLILDKDLQMLPWESVSILKTCSVSRMPSLQSLLQLSLQKETDAESILNRGVNKKEVFYAVDPEAILEEFRRQLKCWFCREQDWQGVFGVAPDAHLLQDALATKDLYIYVGHGGGEDSLDIAALLKRPLRAAVLLFGCSSAALEVRGGQEGQGIILYYLLAGCPLVLGTLWDVTDSGIYPFVEVLLTRWLEGPTSDSLLDYVPVAREATSLNYMVGAAPVIYGLPVHLMHNRTPKLP